MFKAIKIAVFMIGAYVLFGWALIEFTACGIPDIKNRLLYAAPMYCLGGE